MEQARLLIAIALSFLVFFVWNFFFVDQEAVEGDGLPVAGLGRGRWLERVLGTEE